MKRLHEPLNPFSTTSSLPNETSSDEPVKSDSSQLALTDAPSPSSDTSSSGIADSAMKSAQQLLGTGQRTTTSAISSATNTLHSAEIKSREAAQALNENPTVQHMKESAKKAAEIGIQKTGQLFETVKDYTGDALQKGEEYMNIGMKKTGELLENAKYVAGDNLKKAAEMIADTTVEGKDTVSAISSNVAEKTASAAREAISKSEELKDVVLSKSEEIGEIVNDKINYSKSITEAVYDNRQTDRQEMDRDQGVLTGEVGMEETTDRIRGPVTHGMGVREETTDEEYPGSSIDNAQDVELVEKKKREWKKSKL
ncbi:hypothetical protein BKA69DRAFT_1128343 [Paraphysoderma sedebokerense]|nr:hypothetical protein BKA69DRAFT_1128343 [Paraphysoderma sedebokerense]